MSTNAKKAVCQVGYCKIETEQVVVTMPGNILMCLACSEREKEMTRKLQSEADARVAATRQFVQTARKQDNKIEVQQDFFNANTMAAIDVKKAIAEDESIAPADKQFEYARFCDERVQQFDKVMFELQTAIQKAVSSQKFWQMQLQSTIPSLRKEQQAFYQKANNDYQPKPQRTPKKPEPTPVKTKFNRVEAAEWLIKLGLPAALTDEFVSVALMFHGLDKKLTTEGCARKAAEIYHKK